MSALNVRVDGRYCLGVKEGFVAVQGTNAGGGGTQNFSNYRNSSLIVIMSLNLHSPSVKPDYSPIS